MLFLIRLVPAVPFFRGQPDPAFVGVPLHRFVISTFLGIIPGAVVYTSVGAGLGEVLPAAKRRTWASSSSRISCCRSLGLSRWRSARRHQSRTRQERSVNMKRIKTDICIIGAGSGGLSIAAGAVQMGAKVVLLEGHKMGGDCLNYGCVPSKALIAAANRPMPCARGNLRRDAGDAARSTMPPPRITSQM